MTVLVRRLAFATCFVVGTVLAQEGHDHTQMTAAMPMNDAGTAEVSVSERQAADLTLTLVEVKSQALQTWVRTSGRLVDGEKTLIACLSPAESELVQLGQRVRAFPPDWKSSVSQGRITQISPLGDDCVEVEATLSGVIYQDRANYVMEIIVERGIFTAIPTEAIIEEGDAQIVYVEQMTGHYMPRSIHTGLRGELYTEVMQGLESGERVVTLGSFFVDSDYKLKSVVQDGEAMGDAHIHH